MENYPKSVEELVEQYDKVIKDWIKYNDKYGLDQPEFISSFYEKCLTKNTLEKFVPSVGVKFKTWLDRVLLRHYLTLIRKEKAQKNLPGKISIEDDDKFRRDLESKIGYEEDYIPKVDIKKISKHLSAIKPVKKRLLIKLKLFHLGLFDFDDEEYDLMEEKSGIKRDKIDQFIEKHKKEDGVIKGTEIAKLTGYAEGSISSSFDRIEELKEIVKKEFLIPYKIGDI